MCLPVVQDTNDEQQTQTIQELTELNHKLSQDLQIVSVHFFLSIDKTSFLSNRVEQMNQDYKNN